MSTSDVPGAKTANNDVLAMGCWAEHEDGSLIVVESTEAGSVIYSIFDVAKTPPVEYRDAMSEKDFEKQFTWKPKSKKSIKWTWHDKTPFPWERVMSDFPSGVRRVSATEEISAAQRVGESLDLRAEAVRDRSSWMPKQVQDAAVRMMDKIGAAVGKLGK